ncbi:hypothetical protein [Kitasatospora sp. NBC_00070]|uniref:hypothetical protein n=1 Tax=Kitasatospora sp. NBC_00070 TaxID=2975962 RepID=UPI0038602D5A
MGKQEMVAAMWRAADLTRAYLTEDRAAVGKCLAGVEADGLDRLLAWLVLDHDWFFTELGEPAVPVLLIEAMAALAPPESEFAVTTAVRRVASGETGLAAAVEGLHHCVDQVHAVAVCTVVMLVEAFGRAGALDLLDGDAAEFVSKGYRRWMSHVIERQVVGVQAASNSWLQTYRAAECASCDRTSDSALACEIRLRARCPIEKFAW